VSGSGWCVWVTRLDPTAPEDIDVGGDVPVGGVHRVFGCGEGAAVVVDPFAACSAADRVDARPVVAGEPDHLRVDDASGVSAVPVAGRAPLRPQQPHAPMVANVCSPNQEMQPVTDQYDPTAAKLRSTTNARVWAQEFADLFRIVREEGGGYVDDVEGLMIGWFANAIETGSMHEARRRPKTADHDT
jgi:hypothetical protein